MGYICKCRDCDIRTRGEVQPLAEDLWAAQDYAVCVLFVLTAVEVKQLAGKQRDYLFGHLPQVTRSLE